MQQWLGLLIFSGISFGWVTTVRLADLADWTPAIPRLLVAAAGMVGALIAGNILRHRLFYDPALRAMTLLPMDNETILRRQLRRWVKTLASMGLFAALMMLALGLRAAAPIGVLAVSIAGGLGLAIIWGALAWLGLRHAWLTRGTKSVLLVTVAVVLVCWAFPAVRGQVVASLVRVADVLTCLLPTGWIIYPLDRALDAPFSRAWLALAPAVYLVWQARREARAFRHQVSLGDLALLSYAAQLPPHTPEEVEEAFHRQIERPAPPPVEEVKAVIAGRSFLGATRPPPTDLLFGLVWRWWTPRERLLAEWGLAAWPAWRKRWLRQAGLVLGGLALLWVARVSGRGEALLVGAVAAALGVSGTLPWLFLFQRAVRRTWIAPVSVPLLQLHPVTLRELLRADRKRVVLQVALALPIVALGCVPGAWLLGLRSTEGWVVAAKVLLLLLLVRALLSMGWCARLWLNHWRSWLLLAGLIPCGLVTLALGLVSCVSLEPTTLVPLSGCVALAKAVEWVIFRCWARRWFENTLGNGL